MKKLMLICVLLIGFSGLKMFGTTFYINNNSSLQIPFYFHSLDCSIVNISNSVDPRVMQYTTMPPFTITLNPKTTYTITATCPKFTSNSSGYIMWNFNTGNYWVSYKISFDQNGNLKPDDPSWEVCETYNTITFTGCSSINHSSELYNGSPDVQHIQVMDKSGKTIQEKDVDPNSSLTLVPGTDINIESYKGVQHKYNLSSGKDIMITTDNKLKELSDIAQQPEDNPELDYSLNR